jgi:hypothetical protein
MPCDAWTNELARNCRFVGAMFQRAQSHLSGKSSRTGAMTVSHWLSGKRNPSSTALVLAGELHRASLEMAPGLLVATERD